MKNLTQQSDCYKLLAACFYEPDKQLFLEEHVCENLADILKDIAPEATPAAKNMQKAIAEMSAEELLIDYARLFVGPFELIAPPYGSVYLEGKNLVMGDSTMAVLKKYQAAGLAIDIKEPPDHIAFELEFLHFLAALELGAFDKGDNKKQQEHAALRKEFLHTFLAPWVPGFCERIRQGTDNSFYKNLANCLQKTITSFIASETQAHTPHMMPESEDDASRTFT